MSALTRRLPRLVVVALALWWPALPVDSIAAKDLQGPPEQVWDDLERRGDRSIALSIKYRDRDARSAAIEKVKGFADLSFISRLLVETTGVRAAELRDRDGIEDIEIIEKPEVVFHHLYELYRVFHYAISERFPVAAINFSQGVELYLLNKGLSGERTVVEALERLASRVVPVFVAAGNEPPPFGMNPWSRGPSSIPVVATRGGGQEILPTSSRPSRASDVGWELVVYADGDTTPLADDSAIPAECRVHRHLTVERLIRPENASIPGGGGSSFATFKATWNACFVHQYTEVVRAHLSATAPIGYVQVEPFIAYYIDTPIPQACPLLTNRWADKPNKYAPRYLLRVEDKKRIQDFLYGNVVEFRIKYSPAVLKKFFKRLTPRNYTDVQTQERYVDSNGIVRMLKELTFSDLVDMVGNKRSYYFSKWRSAGAADRAPVLRSELIDAIDSYCRDATLFVAMPDDYKDFLQQRP